MGWGVGKRTRYVYKEHTGELPGDRVDMSGDRVPQGDGNVWVKEDDEVEWEAVRNYFSIALLHPWTAFWRVIWQGHGPTLMNLSLTQLSPAFLLPIWCVFDG